jgi:FKBP-type peptidyl-prolyl cis-trans isomerase FklB
MNKPATAALVGLGLALGSALVLAQDEKTTTKPAAPAEAAATPTPKVTQGKAAPMKDLKSKASYSIGLEYGKSIKPQVTGLELDIDSLLNGLRVSLTGGKSELTDADIQETMIAFQKEVMKKRMAEAEEKAAPEIKATAAKNKKDGDAALAQNKTKPGVVVTKSGLQYKVVKEGKGVSPKASDTVNVHYRGTLIDGKEFDSSYKRGKPATFPVGGVIPGWTEALQLMKPGAKYQLVIPSELAYGFAGQGQDIGPNTVLLFEVELIGIE